MKRKPIQLEVECLKCGHKEPAEEFGIAQPIPPVCSKCGASNYHLIWTGKQ